MTDKTPAPRFLGSSYASGTKQGQTAEVSSDGGEPVTLLRRECLATATGAGFGSLPYIYDHGNSPDLTQWLAHVKAFGWPFEAFDDPRKKIAALYVQTGGAYFDLPGVDPWDEARDARKYDGPWPVVAHPPCQRWGAMAVVNYTRWGGEHNQPGNDGGCFAAALESVRRFGGVLEHPAKSRAWAEYGLMQPRLSGWQKCDDGGWVCEVWQSAYGHRANKATWLYAFGLMPPPLNWSRPVGTHQVGFHDQRGKAKNKPTLSRKEAAATPPAFRELLIAIAKSATPALFDDPRNVKDGE